MFSTVTLATYSLLFSAVLALDNGFTRPPMGWSALYGAPFGTVNETIVRAAAQGLKDGGFTSAGYGYVILDDWYATRDANNRIIGLPSTWPSGMASTSDFIHNLGLKFGVYSAASQRTCGNYSASQFLEEQDADTFANEWKIDWLKYDSCYYSNGVASRARYTTMRDALNKTGRQIFYSMEGQAYFPDVGNMWRTGGDIWPKWDECVLRNLYSNNAQASLFKPGAGAFNDPDMLQATGTEGGTTLTFEEARAQFVLWCVMKSPLILGAHYSLLATMRTDHPDYFALLTHPELIAINQDISPQATLTQSMPSTLQQGVGSEVQVSLQACDPRREDQKFIAAGAGASPLHAIQSLHGGLCLTSSPSSPSGPSVFASPCNNSSSTQSWPGLLPSQLSVAQSGAQEGMCLGVTGSLPSTGPCIYSGSLPPPFELSLGNQLWVYDMKGNLIHGESGECLTLGLPNLGDSTYTTNNGTLQAEVWGGPISTGRVVVVLFNKGPLADTISVEWPALNPSLPMGKTLPIRDVWAMADLPPAQNLSALVQPHGVRVFLVG